MPQLDRFAFVSQVLWIIGAFFGMYFLILRMGLPKIFKVLSFRRKKIEFLREGVVNLEKEVYFLNKNTKGFILNFVKSFKELPVQLERIVDENLENKRLENKKYRDRNREFTYAIVNKTNISRDLHICKILDMTNFVKDKVAIRKKVVGN